MVIGTASYNIYCTRGMRPREMKMGLRKGKRLRLEETEKEQDE